MDSIRFRLQLAVVSALLILGAAGGSTAASAATPSDTILARLHAIEAPCDKAVQLVDEATKLPRVESGATADSAYRAKRFVQSGRRQNQLCPGALTGHEQQLLKQGALVDRAYWKSLLETKLANEAVLSSVDIQANLILQLLHKPFQGDTRFTAVDPKLAACQNNRGLLQRVRDICKWQLIDNRQTEHPSGAPDAHNPCTRATSLADQAGKALGGDVESAHDNAHLGLDADKRCNARDAHDINEAYLLSWKAASDVLLNIPLQNDADIVRDPGNASPFAVSNRELDACRDRTGYDRGVGADIAKQCGTQRAFNAQFERQYRDSEQPPPPPTGSQPLTPTPIDSAGFAVRAQYDWTQKAPGPGEAERFSVERVRQGPAWVDAGTQDVRSGRQPWVLFSVIRTWPEFTDMFEPVASSAPVTPDFFKTKMLIVAVQRSPRQRCTLDPVSAYSVPGTTALVVPALLVSYHYVCGELAPVVPGEPAVTSILALPRNNNGSVSFLENGASLANVR